MAHLAHAFHIVVRRTAAFAVGLILSALTAAAQTEPPDGWIDASINGGSGSWSYNGDDLVVRGAGADIWGTADSFHFVYQPLNGDGEFRSEVVRLEGPHEWTKVGIMIRQSTAPGSPHHSLLVSKARGLAYQRRTTAGGFSSHTSLGTGAGPVWFRIVRRDTRVELGMSSDGLNWTLVAGVNWPTGQTLVGFAVSSHDTSTTPTATGWFDNVALTGNGTTPPNVNLLNPSAGTTVPAGQPYTIRWEAGATSFPISHFDAYSGTEQNGRITYERIPGCAVMPPTAVSCTWASPEPSTAAHVLVIGTDRHSNQGRAESGPFTVAPMSGGLPAGWSHRDIGRVPIAGNATFDSGSFSVTGSGADIWGTADAFHFAHVNMSGDFTITARVPQVENVHPWTKAGVMIRESFAAGARHASFFLTPTSAKGTAFQYRPTTDGASVHVPGPVSEPPVWVKLVRIEWAVTAYYRKNTTDPWTVLHREVFNNLAPSLEVGLAVTSHDVNRTATARFTDVVVEPLPPWQIYSIASGGPASTDQTIFTLNGQGSDIWGTADAMMGTFVPWTGDGTMTARVRSLDPSHAWAKAGVMFRESLTTGSKHVFALVSAARGVALQYRAATSGQSASAASAPGSASLWLRLTRRGDTFVGEYSVDGRAWTHYGTVTVPMGQTLYVGLAHTSHNTSDGGRAMFDDLRITR